MTEPLTQQSKPPVTESLSATYSAKDVILFALSIGFGSSEEHYDSDLRFLYEDHEQFEVVSLWGLALPFLAHFHGERPLLPSFPPPLMSSMGLIPTTNLRNGDISLQDYPLLHMFQSIEWHTFFPPVTRDTSSTLKLLPSFKSIQPKSIGTFVTTEIIVIHHTTPVCTIQSTALILGLSSEHVIPFLNSEKPSLNKANLVTGRAEMGEVWLEKRIKVDSNVALLYRMTSGDTNRIHVLPVVSEKPLLHGLCTLAMAAASILQRLPDCTPTMLQANFTKPVLINDTILIQVWKRKNLEFGFIVFNETQDEVCVDKGYFALKRREPFQKTSRL